MTHAYKELPWVPPNGVFRGKMGANWVVSALGPLYSDVWDEGQTALR